MARTTQIYTLEDLYERRFQPLSTLNLERVSATIQAYGQFLAQDMAEQLDAFTEETTVSRAVWGGAAQMEFQEVGELGKAKTNKDTRGQELHFPLFKLDLTVGGSEEFWKRAGIKNLIDVMNGMDNAYAERVRNEIKAAVFNKSLHTPVLDWIGDDTRLDKIQPFLNADSNEIPVAPNGTSFTASSHTHYLGITGSSLSYGDVDRVVNTVREHVLGKVYIYVDGAMPATLAALSGTKYVGRPPSPIADQSAT